MSMIRIFRKIHRICYLTSVFLFFIIFFPFLLFLCKRPEKYYNQIAFCRKWISILGAYTVGIRFQVRHEVPIDWSQPYVLCANHTSILDITAITHLCKQPFSFLGKVELLKNPVTRIFFKSIDITVDRKSRISAFKAFKRANELLVAGRSVVVFPEGKIDDGYPPQLHEFKSGPFRMAIQNNIPIIPIIIHNAWDVLWDSGLTFGSRPGIVQSTILAPISTDGYTDENSGELQLLIYEKMKTHWETNKIS